MSAEIHPTAIVHEGTVLGEGVKVLEYAVVGKQPTLSPRSTARRDPLPQREAGQGLHDSPPMGVPFGRKPREASRP